MAESEQVSQEEIEALVRQAKSQQDASQADQPDGGAGVADPGQLESLLGRQAATQSSSPAAGEEDDSIAAGDVELLLRQAEAALASIDEEATLPADVKPYQLRDLTGAPPSKSHTTLELLRDVELDLKIELGRTHLPLEDVLKLRQGSVVPLDKLAGDPVDIYVNGRLIARGEVLVLNDNFCVRVAELLAGEAPK